MRVFDLELGKTVEDQEADPMRVCGLLDAIQALAVRKEEEQRDSLIDELMETATIELSMADFVEALRAASGDYAPTVVIKMDVEVEEDECECECEEKQEYLSLMATIAKKDKEITQLKGNETFLRDAFNKVVTQNKFVSTKLEELENEMMDLQEAGLELLSYASVVDCLEDDVCVNDFCKRFLRVYKTESSKREH